MREKLSHVRDMLDRNNNNKLNNCKHNRSLLNHLLVIIKIIKEPVVARM